MTPKPTPPAAVHVMPSRAPLAFPAQDLKRCFRDPNASGLAPLPWGARSWRWGILLASFLLAAGLTALMALWFSGGGWTPTEWTLTALGAVTLGWIALPFASSLAALAAPRPTQEPQPEVPLKTAILVPIHEEDVARVFAMVARLATGIASAERRHSYDIFILSDSQSPRTTQAEALAYAALSARTPGSVPIYYRRRAENTDRKAGNLADWVRGWGGAYDAMLPLDADSHMTPEAVETLSDALAADPTAGLIQSHPRLVHATSLFGRLQQFSVGLYGPLLFRGLTLWAGAAGNYWGHNAICRTQAFAASAGLPRLGRRKRLIMSHDFVEAALLRRAGWGVRLLPGVTGSLEECPQGLIEFCLRDRRWCRGNLQHLRLLAVPGLHPLSRLHLLHGAVGYLMAPIWFALLIGWIAHAHGAALPELIFNGNDPRYLQINTERPEVLSVGLMLAIYGTLLGPKLMAVARALLSPSRAAGFGGPARLIAGVLAEIGLSVLYAPVLMVQQSKAVLASLTGRSQSWAPQLRAATHVPFSTALRFHWAETLMGAAGIAALAAGALSLWLLPVVVSLILAAPLSVLSALPARQLWPMPEEGGAAQPSGASSASTQSITISAQ